MFSLSGCTSRCPSRACQHGLVCRVGGEGEFITHMLLRRHEMTAGGLYPSSSVLFLSDLRVRHGTPTSSQVIQAC